MSKQLVRLRVNGSAYEREAEPRETLADFLRVQCALTGTHLACEHGRCGACTVLLDGEDVRSCLLFAVQAEGAEITTIEGIADHDGTLAPIQRAFQQAHGLQCGFCTPGFIVTLHAYLRDGQSRARTWREFQKGGHAGQSVSLHRVSGDYLRGAHGRLPARRGSCIVNRSEGSTALREANFVQPGIIGQSIRRREDTRLLTGSGQYVDDVILPGMLHAAFVRSPVARARIIRIDTTEALALPGVAAVLTGSPPELIPRMPLSVPGMAKTPDKGPLAAGDVRFVGDPVAIVVAESRYVAEDGSDLVRVEYDCEVPVLDYQSAHEARSLRVHPEMESNVAWSAGSGNDAGRWRKAALTHRACRRQDDQAA